MRQQHDYAWMTLAAAGLLLGALGLGMGCDDKNDVSPEVLRAQQQRQQQEAAAATKPGPTTQQLLTGPKKHLRLPGFPLTLDVPNTWDLRSVAEGALITVSGPATSGEINVQLVAQTGRPIPAARISDIAANAKKEVEAKPHAINRVDLRQVGPLKVLEQRMISNEFVGGKLPAEVESEVEVTSEKIPDKVKVKSVLNPHLVKWTFTVFIPGSKDEVTTRSLTFLGLKLSEYQQDREFLEQLMKSLTYEE